MFYRYLGFFTAVEARWLLAERQAWAGAVVVAALLLVALIRPRAATGSEGREQHGVQPRLWQIAAVWWRGVAIAAASWGPGYLLMSFDLPVSWDVSDVPAFSVFVVLAAAGLAGLLAIGAPPWKLGAVVGHLDSRVGQLRGLRASLAVALVLLSLAAAGCHVGTRSSHQMVAHQQGHALGWWIGIA